MFNWTRFNGYEVSSQGDKRFSALNAIMSDGRSLECHYQCDVKGFEPGGTNWRLGKGKSAVNGKSYEQLWEEYLNLWRLWAKANIELVIQLYLTVNNDDKYNYCLSDKFAKTPINQARALSVILNELEQNNTFNKNMKTITGSILQESTGIIVHGVNCQGVMGSGVAMQLKNKYSRIYTDYIEHCNQYKHNKEKLLGNIVITKINEELYIVSAFTQLYYGRDSSKQYVDYKAIKNCFSKVNDLYLETALPVKFPKIGAGLGGGNWDIISSIINNTLIDEIQRILFVYE